MIRAICNRLGLLDCFIADDSVPTVASETGGAPSPSRRVADQDQSSGLSAARPSILPASLSLSDAAKPACVEIQPLHQKHMPVFPSNAEGGEQCSPGFLDRARQAGAL